MVELKSMEFVPAREEKGDSEGSQATVLSVGLLVVTDIANYLLHRHWLLVGIQISTSAKIGQTARKRVAISLRL